MASQAGWNGFEGLIRPAGRSFRHPCSKPRHDASRALSQSTTKMVRPVPRCRWHGNRSQSLTRRIANPGHPYLDRGQLVFVLQVWVGSSGQQGSDAPVVVLPWRNVQSRVTVNVGLQRNISDLVSRPVLPKLGSRRSPWVTWRCSKGCGFKIFFSKCNFKLEA